MKLNRAALADERAWELAEVTLPGYDVGAMADATRKAPVWMHFGAGNIFRGFIARLQQRLLEQGAADRGIVAAETFDGEIISGIYEPYDNLTLLVSLMPDGQMKKEIVASIAYGVALGSEGGAGELRRIFAQPSLQIVSFTITEKGYALRGISGETLGVVKADMAEGPDIARHAMSVTAALLLERYNAGAHPIALVSMDNCSRNGEKVQNAVWEIADAWKNAGFVDEGFVAYLHDTSKVAFPWTMIDKITPRPDAKVLEHLEGVGVEDIDIVTTAKGTYIAPFVNAEAPEYLVIEDVFPNGRPALEKAGVYLTNRETVNRVETMKVTTCLNPLHTALAVFGCLLGYDRICAEMKDPDLVNLVEAIGYTEGMPVVVDPGIISPRAFLDEVVEERLPNPFMPDMPQRIATDTSVKIPIRFGETIKRYIADPALDTASLTAIPLAIAAWARYLLGKDDELSEMVISADPMLEQLQETLVGVTAGQPESYAGQLKPLLSNANLFGCDLNACGLGEKIEGMFVDMLRGKGAVRNTLRAALG